MSHQDSARVDDLFAILAQTSGRACLDRVRIFEPFRCRVPHPNSKRISVVSPAPFKPTSACTSPPSTSRSIGCRQAPRGNNRHNPRALSCGSAIATVQDVQRRTDRAAERSLDVHGPIEQRGGDRREHRCCGDPGVGSVRSVVGIVEESELSPVDLVRRLAGHETPQEDPDRSNQH